jgi:hypothetical protein
LGNEQHAVHYKLLPPCFPTGASGVSEILPQSTDNGNIPGLGPSSTGNLLRQQVRLNWGKFSTQVAGEACPAATLEGAMGQLVLLSQGVTGSTCGVYPGNGLLQPWCQPLLPLSLVASQMPPKPELLTLLPRRPVGPGLCRAERLLCPGSQHGHSCSTGNGSICTAHHQRHRCIGQ